MLTINYPKRLSTLYTYGSKSYKGGPAALARNEKLAGWVARRLGYEFGGDHKSGHVPTESRSTFWVPHMPVTPDEAKILHITSQDHIFGAVVDPLHAQKSVFHRVLPDAEFVPERFPFAFADCIQTIASPGYTVFTLRDGYRAFEALTRQGYRPRYKNPCESAGKGQVLLEESKDLASIWGGLDQEQVTRFGIVIEANVTRSGMKAPAFSSGWIVLGGKTYSYVGRQFTGTENKYAGTCLHMVRGEKIPFSDDVPSGVTRQTESIRGWLPLLHGLQVATRCNFNFIAGDNDDVFVLEPTFRLGGATAAELLASELLDQNPRIATATATTHHVHDRTVPILPGAHILFNELTPTRLKQIFAHLGGDDCSICNGQY